MYIHIHIKILYEQTVNHIAEDQICRVRMFPASPATPSPVKVGNSGKVPGGGLSQLF